MGVRITQLKLQFLMKKKLINIEYLKLVEFSTENVKIDNERAN